MPRALVLALAALSLAGCRRSPPPADPAAYQRSGRGDDPRVDRSASGFHPLATQGQVTRPARGRSLELAAPDGQRLTLGTDPTTRVEVEGRKLSLRELRPGDEVRASYYLEDKRPVAKHIEVVRPAPR